MGNQKGKVYPRTGQVPGDLPGVLPFPFKVLRPADQVFHFDHKVLRLPVGVLGNAPKVLRGTPKVGRNPPEVPCHGAGVL